MVSYIPGGARFQPSTVVIVANEGLGRNPLQICIYPVVTGDYYWEGGQPKIEYLCVGIRFLLITASNSDHKDHF